MGCVYLAENTVNKKCYIGKTIGTLEQRKREHKASINATKHINIPFRNALRKYDFEEFEWIKLYENKSNEKLIEKEIYFIRKYQTISPNGYNVTKGGEGIAGYVHSEETLKKLRGRKCTKESCERMVNAQKNVIYKERFLGTKEY